MMSLPCDHSNPPSHSRNKKNNLNKIEQFLDRLKVKMCKERIDTVQLVGSHCVSVFVRACVHVAVRPPLLFVVAYVHCYHIITIIVVSL